MNKSVRPSIFFILSFIICRSAFGQAANDNIGKRSRLILDSEYMSSSTREATVEWNCINRSLTNKCLSYHNDQWFTFSVAHQGKYYLNISSQSCRDSNGIQAIVIEGNPCEISTYHILHCIPRIRQQDVYIELDSLKENVSYLVNIDGFLGDYCSFDIQLSSRPNGFSHLSANLDTLHLSAKITNRVVTLQWEIPEGLADDLKSFELYRSVKQQTKAAVIKSIPLNLNSLGIAEKVYTFTDTLGSENTYTYEIAGVLKDGRKEILDRERVGLNYEIRSSNQQVLNFTLDYKDGVNLQLLLLERRDERVLRQSTFKYNKALDSQKNIFVGNYVKAGIVNFTVRVINLKTHQKTDHVFFVSPEGKVLKK